MKTFPKHQEKLGGSVPWSGAALEGLGISIKCVLESELQGAAV